MDQSIIATVWVVAYEDSRTNVFTTRLDVFNDQEKAQRFVRRLLLLNIKGCSHKAAHTIRAFLDGAVSFDIIQNALAFYYAHFAESCGDITWGAFDVDYPELSHRV